MSKVSKFFYLRDLNKHPVACVSLELNGNVVKWGLATCHELDLPHFTKARARSIARSRMEQKPHQFVVAQDTKFQLKDLVENMLTQKLPKRVEKMAKLWSNVELVKQRREQFSQMLTSNGFNATDFSTKKLVNDLVEKSFNL